MLCAKWIITGRSKAASASQRPMIKVPLQVIDDVTADFSASARVVETLTKSLSNRILGISLLVLLAHTCQLMLQLEHFFLKLQLFFNTMLFFLSSIFLLFMHKLRELVQFSLVLLLDLIDEVRVHRLDGSQGIPHTRMQAANDLVKCR
jgi:hypothetical protein